MKKPIIGVIGLGFVGSTLAVTNAKKGFETIVIDINKEKIENFKKGKPDLYEPLLEKYLNQSLKLKKISFSNEINKIIGCDIIFITVGTPSNKKGEISLQYLKKVINDLLKKLNRKKTKCLIVIKSTVIPNTTEWVSKKFKSFKNVGVVVNPEFLREGSAINDLLNPHLIVIGSDKKENANLLEKYYKLFYNKKQNILQTNFPTAEFIKYSNNAFLATKISFINSMANVCQNFPNVDIEIIANAIGRDKRIGPLFLKAGPGFGGSCLPKDLNALISFSNKFSNTNNLFKAVKNVNEEQPTKIISLMKNIGVYKPNKIISILGLSFKKNTDDIRESISIKLIKKLLGKGIKIKVHDPMALENVKKIFKDKIQYNVNIDNCLKQSDCCIVLTDWDDYTKLSLKDFKNMKRKNIIDARRVLDPKQFSKINFKAIGLGK
jgi:UDPglucose 6-dehydrogenase